MPAQGDEEATKYSPTGTWSPLLEIVGLWTLAVLLPLLELIGAEAPFLLHHRPDTLDLALTVAALALGVPVFLLVLEAVAGRFFGSNARRHSHLVILAMLASLLFLGILRKLDDPLPAWILLPVIGGIAWGALTALGRWPVARAACRLLAAALPLAVALFWFSPGARAVRADTRGSAAAAEAQPTPETTDPEFASPPVVWAVFDELPLLSLIDADLQIDREAFPNLAAFAEHSTWYRNATTVWSSTAESVVSMLTGTTSEPRVSPTRDRHPDNLLTWLAPSHRVHSLEMVTSLAPPAAVDLAPRPARSVRLSGLLSDTTIVAAQMLAPPWVGAALPAIDNRWGDFADSRVVRTRARGGAAPERRNRWDFALADARDEQFRNFLQTLEPDDRPGLHFIHLMLPHMPFRYLPSGHVYGGRPASQRPAEAWLENEWFALQTYQRHLLQVAFVDRLVGDLRARLEATGLWDRAIVVITSDHGVSHWPGQDRRLPTETEHPEDILRVPLFLRAPGQTEGRIDDAPARTVDILPTLAALLGRGPLPWPHDGVVLRAGRDPATSRRLFHPRGEPLTFAATATPDAASLARKLELFAPHSGPWRWTRLGPFRLLVGASLETLSVESAPSGCRAVVDQLPVLEHHDPAARYSPAFLTGEISCVEPPPLGTHLGVVMNGVVSGTTELAPAKSGTAPFAVMTNEAVLEPGRNRLELLLLSGDPTELRIERVELATQRDG